MRDIVSSIDLDFSLVRKFVIAAAVTGGIDIV